MKLLLEKWRKIMEGEVIDLFPQEPQISEEDIQRVINLEDTIGEILGELYGNQSEIPFDVLERMEDLIMSIEESLRK